MTKYRKKPVEIEAMRWDGEVKKDHPVAVWIRENGGQYTYTPGPDQQLGIETLEGTMLATPGDMIIRGVQGEFYPCKPDIFEATYDLVE